jgi:uridine phosphorylase
VDRHPDDVRQPILGIRRTEVAPRALVVGDPDRVAAVSERLDDVAEVGRSREYVTVTGRFAGVAVTVASHGVGASGAAICFEELCRAGVTRIVRAGTAGGLQPAVDAGSIVVGTAAVRDEGMTDRLVDPGWPAVADTELTVALDRAARERHADVHTGIVHTAANFYPPPSGDAPRWTIFQAAGAVAVEMEYAALLVIAALHGVRAGGIFAVDGNLSRAATDMTDYDPHTDVVARAKDAMLDAALHALVAPGAD